MRTCICAMVTVCCAVNAASGQVSPIPPFNGEHSDHFVGTPPGSAVQSLPIFGGRVTVEAPLNGGGSVKVEISSSLNGNLLTPHSGGWMVGVLHGDGDSRPGVFIFDDPDVHRFGGYFGNNSPTDDALMQFFDASGNLLGSYELDIPSAGNTWVWHGFESVVPIHTIAFKGFSPDPFSGGFIWFDDLELGLGDPPSPQGACCLDDSVCSVMTQDSCVAAGGQYAGDATTCDDSNGDTIPDACEVFRVTGACCTFRSCGLLQEDECAVANGVYHGDGTTCDDVNGNGQADVCEPPCDGDVNGDRLVGVTDFLAVLAQWGDCTTVCTADVDGDSKVGVIDFLMVLERWGPCP